MQKRLKGLKKGAYQGLPEVEVAEANSTQEALWELILGVALQEDPHVYDQAPGSPRDQLHNSRRSYRGPHVHVHLEVVGAPLTQQ